MKRLLLLVMAVSLLAGCGNAEPDVDIWSAAGTGNVAAIDQHVAFGTDLNGKELLNGGTPLIVAALYDQTDAASVLVENGANLEIKNNDGSTPLHVAAFFGHPDMVTLLLDAGADPESRNNNGQTALDVVSMEWTPELEQLYLFFADSLEFDLDTDAIKAARPEIADLLRQHGD